MKVGGIFLRFPTSSSRFAGLPTTVNGKTNTISPGQGNAGFIVDSRVLPDALKGSDAPAVFAQTDGSSSLPRDSTDPDHHTSTFGPFVEFDFPNFGKSVFGFGVRIAPTWYVTHYGNPGKQNNFRLSVDFLIGKNH